MVRFLSVWFAIYSEDHALEMVFARQKTRAGANPESPRRNQLEINIREVRTPSHTVFTQEQNELFFPTICSILSGFGG